jgi:dsRNA-specific ribonuclease
MATTGHQHRAQRAEEQEDHDHHDQERLEGVFTTSSMALWMYLVASKATVRLDLLGQVLLEAAISERTFFMTSRELALGSVQMPMNTAVLPLKRTSVS